ncbi:MAG: glycerophosphodiester phosphodiesterase [Verrucomicrobia bacterium]|nr:glycerophosphodiester phosphodiesterase [Verrucomicrobiota bacterium]
MKTSRPVLAAALCALILPSVARAAAPLVIAHRGASGYLPEHTLEAKAYAHALGADYLEQDLVLTKDDVPVVLHDIYLDTVSDVAARFPDRKRADGRFYALDLTLAELKQLRVSERFSAKTGRPVYPQRYDSKAAPSEFRVSTLEEELQLIQALNRSTGRRAGIYPEIKQPKWHREQGHDISRIVLPILARYGYATKEDPCYLQCFELTEVRRLRGELGWKGRLVMLIAAAAKEADGVDHGQLCTAEGLAELAALVDGIGPNIGRIVTWAPGGAAKVSELTKLAHAKGLVVHPYTVRWDDLPKGCPSVDDLHTALFRHAGVDGVFTDFTDVTVKWLRGAAVR